MIKVVTVRTRTLLLIAVMLSLSACATIPSSPEDLALQRTVQNAIFFAPELASPGINASVRDGVVILQGTVKSGFDRWIAEKTAAEVEGVIRVYNYVHVRRRSDR